MDIGLAGGAYQSLPINTQQSINLYTEVVEANGRTDMYLRPSGGLISQETGFSGPCRAMISLDGFIYAVYGEDLIRFQEGAGAAINLGTIPGTLRLATAHNENFLVFIDELFDGYVYDITGGLLQQITDPDFPNAGDVAYLDGYFIVSEAGTQRFYWSAVGDPLNWNALDFAAKESDPSPIVGMIVNNGDLFLLGGTNMEAWRTIPSNLSAFQLLEGSERDTGLIARDTPIEVGESFYFLGDDRIVYRVDAYNPRRVSNHALEAELQKLDLETIQASYATTYTHEGHYFYCLTAGEHTWVYDATTSALIGQHLWHERRSHQATDNLDAQRPWRVNHIVEAFGRDYVGDSLEGTIGYLTDEVRNEYGLPIKAVRTLRPIFSDVDFLTHSRLELRIRNGVGTIDAPALMWLESSYDGGRTWTDPKIRSMGVQGDYDIRCIWRRLGRSVDRIFRFSTTDDRPFAWISAHLDGAVRG